MRIRTAVAVVLLSGLTWLGMPSAAADELPPTPAETSAVTVPADEPLPAPTPAPSEVPTSEVTSPAPEESDTPTEEPVEPTGQETGDPAEGATTGKPTDAADQTPPAEELDDLKSVEEPPVPAQLPTVSFGPADCTALTVAVTLDNSGPASEATFRVFTNVAYDETVVLPGGAIQVVQVPLVIDHVVVVSVQVFVDGSLVFYPSSNRLDCRDLAKRDPRATVGEVDCAGFRVPLTLDNTRSLEAVRFVVLAGNEDLVESGRHPYFDQRFEVGPGAVRVVQVSLSVVPVIDRDTFWVEVFDEKFFLGSFSSDDLAQVGFSVSCPRVTVRGVDCTHLTSAVTLDNTRSESATTLVVQSGDISVAGGPQHQRSVVVAAQKETVVRVRVRNHTSFGVLVMRDVFPPGPGKEDVLLAKELFDVNCGSPSARPTPNVSVLSAGASQLPSTGGPGLQLLFAALLLIGAGVVMLFVGRSTGDTTTSPASRPNGGARCE